MADPRKAARVPDRPQLATGEFGAAHGQHGREPGRPRTARRPRPPLRGYTLPFELRKLAALRTDALTSLARNEPLRQTVDACAAIAMGRGTVATLTRDDHDESARVMPPTPSTVPGPVARGRRSMPPEGPLQAFAQGRDSRIAAGSRNSLPVGRIGAISETRARQHGVVRLNACARGGFTLCVDLGAAPQEPSARGALALERKLSVHDDVRNTARVGCRPHVVEPVVEAFRIE
jgi:hypothetical protein